MLTRNDVITWIEARLAGRIDDRELAGWAFERFYAEEQGEESFAEEDAELIGEVLDDLMFADEAAFALDRTALQAMIERLREL